MRAAVDNKLPEQEYKCERQRSQTLASSSSPLRVKREIDDSRRSMTLVSPTSQVDDFLNSCLPGGGEERGQSRHFNDDTARWGDRERQRLSRDEHERQRDRRLDGHTQKINDERRREGDLRYGEDRRHDERRPMVKREPVDPSPSDGRTRDPRRAYGQHLYSSLNQFTEQHGQRQLLIHGSESKERWMTVLVCAIVVYSCFLTFLFEQLQV